MKKLMQKTAEHMLGAMLGLVTGFAASFIPGFYYFIEHSAGSLGDTILYFLSLPWFLLLYISKGVYTGARYGLHASLYFAQQVNESFEMQENNTQLVRLLDQVVVEPRNPPVLLVEEEELALRQIINNKKIPIKKRKILTAEYKNYEIFLAKASCPLTGKTIGEIQSPIEVKMNHHSYICEHNAFVQLVNYCKKKSIPVNMNGIDKPAKEDIITKKHLFVFNHRSLPDKVSDFIIKTRNLISSMNLILTCLGVRSLSFSEIGITDSTANTHTHESQEDPHSIYKNLPVLHSPINQRMMK